MGEKKKRRAKESAAEASSKDVGGPTTSGPTARAKAKKGNGSGKRSARVVSDPHPTEEVPVKKKGLHGVPGSKDDSRRCTAQSQRTGKRCRAAAIKGGIVCRVHGGAAPQVKRAAKERLLELVDPALDALRKVLTDPNSDDAVKVRASLGILDRTGHRPGVVLSVEPDDKWSQLLGNVTEFTDDRTMPGIGGGGDRAAIESAGEQFALDANAEAWREYDNEDAEPYVGKSRITPDENTVRGEVVEDPLGNSDFGRHPLDWQHRQGGPGTTEMDAHPQGPYERPAKTRRQEIEDAMRDQDDGQAPPLTPYRPTAGP